MKELLERIAALEERVSALEKKKPKRKPRPKGAIDSLAYDPRINQLLKDVSQELQLQWVEMFKDRPWIVSELHKAQAWILANPQRAPRSNFGRFYNSWLLRGWEKHRKLQSSVTEFNF